MPRCARMTARLTAVVVFATPPFWLQMAIRFCMVSFRRAAVVGCEGRVQQLAAQGIVYASRPHNTTPVLYNLVVMRRRPERLAALRIARGATQAEVAERAGWQQAAVSRLEVRADDAKVSTIRRYIESIGGELRVVAVFRGGDERIVKLREASDVDD